MFHNTIGSITKQCGEIGISLGCKTVHKDSYSRSMMQVIIEDLANVVKVGESLCADDIVLGSAHKTYTIEDIEILSYSFISLLEKLQKQELSEDQLDGIDQMIISLSRIYLYANLLFKQETLLK